MLNENATDEQLDANEPYPQNGPLRVHVALGDDVYEPSPMVFQTRPRLPQPALRQGFWTFVQIQGCGCW
jgi:hypothetical protein